MSALRPAEVTVIGDALLDVTVRPTAPIRPGADAPAEVRTGCGGQGANLAVRLARRGVRVELLCGLADDHAASLVTGALRAEGVVIRAVRVDATGTVVILVDAAAERTMLSQRSPFTGALAEGSPAPAGWLILSGYLFLEPEAPALTAVAASAGRRVVVGCAIPDASVDAWRASVAAAKPDLVILNADEAARLGPLEDVAGGVVVTARDGVSVAIGGVSARHRLPDGPPAVDTTGAGDAFAAAFVARLRREAWPPRSDVLQASLAEASRLAAQVAQVPGAQTRVEAESAQVPA